MKNNWALQHFMLIDDDSTTNFINQKLLVRSGIPKENIITFESGASAFEYLVQNASKEMNVILDLNMPGFNGIDFLRGMTDKNIFIQKVFMSSSSIDPQDIYTCNAYQQCVGHIDKPISIPKLQELLL